MTDATLTHLVCLCDCSGSMYSIAGDMNGAIRQLLTDQAKQEGVCTVDIVTFDTEIKTPYEGVRPDDVKADVIEPGGATALNDALGQTIVRLGKQFADMDEDDRPGHVIFVVITDGYENASREYTHQQVKAMVEEQTQKWGWTFLYLAANVDAFATGAAYGFARGNSMNYGTNTAGVTASTLSTSNLVSNIRAGNASGYTDDDREQALGA